jgi:mono/diheme cytochrome c family protein
MTINSPTNASRATRVASALVLTLCGLLVWLAASPDAAAAPAMRAAPADTLRFVEHPETYPIGWPSTATPLVLTNPFERDAKAQATGARLYVAYNCIDCHGADGSGSMGPSLADGRWHFGGRADEVFESIYQGRPDGMPAWGGRIATDQIWMLVTYVRSLNAGRDVSTENFTGRTVERTGH